MPFAWGWGAGGIGLEGNSLGIYTCQKAKLGGGAGREGGLVSAKHLDTY